MAAWTLVALVYLTQGLAGWLVVRWLWRDPAGKDPAGKGGARGASAGGRVGAGRLGWADVLPRALLLGPAAVAVQMALLSVASLPFTLPIVLAPWWIAAAVAAFAGRRAPPAAGPDDAPAAGTGRWERAMLGLAVALFAGLAWLGLRTPVFESDPLNNFALAARVFATHRGLAPEALAGLVAIGHSEYPPLVALNEALLFLAAGDGGGIGLGLGLRAIMPFFALPWLAFQWLAVRWAFRRLRPGFAVGVSLVSLGIPELFALGTVGLAELRLAATVLLLALEGHALLAGARAAARPRAGAVGRRPPGAPRADGGPPDARRGPSPWPYAAAAATCALTKNEGIALAALAALPLAALGARGRLGAARLAGALLLLLAACGGWIAWLSAHEVGGGYWSAGALSATALDLDRLPRLVAGFAAYPLAPAPGGSLSFGLLWPLAAAAASLGLARSATRAETAAWLAALAVHLVLYALVLLSVPQPIEWSLSQTGLRLVFHATGWLVLLAVAGLAAVAPRA